MREQHFNVQVEALAAPMAEINVTPLVDVCLVLLIIFMVVTPIIVKGVQVEVPVTATPESVPEKADQLHVVVAADGRVFVDRLEVSRERLSDALRVRHAGGSEGKVVLHGDRLLAYREVRVVMQALSEAGYSGATLTTRQRKGDQ